MRLARRRLVAAAVVSALAATSCGQLSHLPRLTAADLRFHPAQSSKIFASDGSLITTLHGAENRTVVPMRRIPRYLRDAVVAIEDRRFYQHGGVDVHAILRALIADVTSGRIEEGGSTITQQYVKNEIIAPNGRAPDTLQRKIDEAALAQQLELRLTKRQILHRYLNTIYFGEGAYGVQAAAKTYFGKGVGHLTLPEAAMIAGTIQSPSDYDPYVHPRRAKHRRNVVLRKMHQQGYIGAARARHARKAPLHLRRAPVSDRYPAPYFVDYVMRLIEYDPRFHFLGTGWKQRERRLYQGGLRIYTTVDLRDQAEAEQAVGSILRYPSDPHGALVSIDPNTGYIKAMVGGRDYFAKRSQDPYAKLNLATVAEPDLGPHGGPAPGSGRQAGSSFKPFALATAIEHGIPLSKTYKAEPCMDFQGVNAGGTWHVCNYEGEAFSHPITLLEATVMSVNVVYAQLILDLGAAAVVRTAREMGIRTHLLAVPSAVLGSNPVNALDMASAYGAFATDGVHHPPVAITKITTADGKVLYRDRSKARQVLPPPVAYLTTTALEQVVQRGTGVNAQIGRPEAGKTGTAEEWRDAWFVGYTPDLVTSVWVGYPQGEISMQPSCYGVSACRPTPIQVQGGSWPAQIWAAYMSRALAGTPPTPFRVPAGSFLTVVIDSRTGCLATDATPARAREKITVPVGSVPQQCAAPSPSPTPSPTASPAPTSAQGVRVPNVFGLPEQKARHMLEGAGFTVSETTRFSRSFPPGHVIAQSPAAASVAPRGSTVTITISTRKR